MSLGLGAMTGEERATGATPGSAGPERRRRLPPRDVLVAEDNVQAVATLREVARQAFPGAMLYVVGAAAQARLMLSTLRPDFVLAGLGIAEPSPQEFIALARAHDPRTQVVVAAQHGDDDRLLPALLGGAAGFVLTRDAPSVIAGHLRDAHAGVPTLTPAFARQLIRHVEAAGIGADLDPRETGLLMWVATGDTLQEAAWRMHTELAAVLASVQRIYRKLRLAGHAEGDGELP